MRGGEAAEEEQRDRRSAADRAAAVAIFAFSPAVAWLSALVLGVGAVLGGLAGAWMLSRVEERLLRFGVVLIGVALTVGIFLYPV